MSEFAPNNQEENEVSKHQNMVLFSDIDGTLIDLNTYSFENSTASLKEIQAKNIPMVFVTSKTQAEVGAFEKDLEKEGMIFHHPYIVENGSGIFIPKNYFSFPINEMDLKDTFIQETEDGSFLTFGGKNYKELQKVLKEKIAPEAQTQILGFGDMTDEELSTDSGLTLEQAHLAKQRNFDEPFKIMAEDPDVVEKIADLIRKEGLEYHGGKRYHHISNLQDKKRATEILTAFYQKELGQIYTLGLGDSPADEKFIAACDTGKIVTDPSDSNQFILEELGKFIKNY